MTTREAGPGPVDEGVDAEVEAVGAAQFREVRCHPRQRGWQICSTAAEGASGHLVAAEQVRGSSRRRAVPRLGEPWRRAGSPSRRRCADPCSAAGAAPRFRAGDATVGRCCRSASAAAPPTTPPGGDPAIGHRRPRDQVESFTVVDMGVDCHLRAAQPRANCRMVSARGPPCDHGQSGVDDLFPVSVGGRPLSRRATRRPRPR